MINYVCNVRGGGKRSWSFAGRRKGCNCRPFGGGARDDWCHIGGEEEGVAGAAPEIEVEEVAALKGGGGE